MLKTIQKEVSKTLKDYSAELEAAFGIDTNDMASLIASNVFGAVAKKVEKERKELFKHFEEEKEKLRKEIEQEMKQKYRPEPRKVSNG